MHPHNLQHPRAKHGTSPSPGLKRKLPGHNLSSPSELIPLQLGIGQDTMPLGLSQDHLLIVLVAHSQLNGERLGGRMEMQVLRVIRTSLFTSVSVFVVKLFTRQAKLTGLISKDCTNLEISKNRLFCASLYPTQIRLPPPNNQIPCVMFVSWPSSQRSGMKLSGSSTSETIAGMFNTKPVPAGKW